MTNTHLHQELRDWADGRSDDVAAVELLIGHGVWLERKDFAPYIERVLDLSGRPITVIDWEGLSEVRTSGLTASTSEVAILDTALSLATGKPISLAEVLGLDSTNTAAVATALVRAAQHTDTVTVTLADPDRPPSV
ncbi:hypothetical protein [Nocardiopsis kunsanensis]|uniref:hypothetical protein n=1 Tax=Nocardiopsis kunsanensis TaxID=141693 RepID=UPI000347207F|nr:hypothetical protein [Nocardiopsis kunsanensis]